MSLFPIFVKLEGRPCLVVGGGPVGESKIASLLSAGASVRVVAPEATPVVAEWAAAGRISWDARPFTPSDLSGVVLVVVAVSIPEIAEEIFRQARARGVLCNSVDDPDRCDFYYPAVVHRGHLQIAVSTDGQSPALAQRLRQELEQQFGPDYEGWLQQLGERRRELFGIEMDPEIRRAQLHEMASARAFQEFVRGPAPAGSPVAVKGTVYLMGAGPGDPELLTLKALRILGQADVVLHDDLLTEEILELVPSTARLERVGKRHGQRQMTQEDINTRLCSCAAQGLVVVRLKGGDGTIFGRAGEEIGALRAAQVPFSIVPGVTSASSAAAAAGVSLTDRRSGSVLAFVTAQRCRGNPAVNWKAIAALGGAVAIYMPGGHQAELARELAEAGLDRESPCVVVSRASRDDERIFRTTLAGLSDAPDPPAPAILLINVGVAGAAGDVIINTYQNVTKNHLTL